MAQYKLVWSDHEFNRTVVGVFELDEIEALRKLFSIMQTENITSGGGGSLKWYTESTDSLVNSSFIGPSIGANVIVNSDSCLVSGDSTQHTSIQASKISSTSSTINVPLAFSTILASLDCNLTASGSGIGYSAVIASESSRIQSRSTSDITSCSTVIASYGSYCDDGNYSASIANYNGNVAESDAGLVAGSRFCVSLRGNNSVILGSESAQIYGFDFSGNPAPVYSSGLLGTLFSSITNAAVSSAVIGSRNSTITQSNDSSASACSNTFIYNSNRVKVAGSLSNTIAGSNNIFIGSSGSVYIGVTNYSSILSSNLVIFNDCHYSSINSSNTVRSISNQYATIIGCTDVDITNSDKVLLIDCSGVFSKLSNAVMIGCENYDFEGRTQYGVYSTNLSLINQPNKFDNSLAIGTDSGYTNPTHNGQKVQFVRYSDGFGPVQVEFAGVSNSFGGVCVAAGLVNIVAYNASTSSYGGILLYVTVFYDASAINAIDFKQVSQSGSGPMASFPFMYSITNDGQMLVVNVSDADAFTVSFDMTIMH